MYVVEKSKCSGCLACREICPVSAIDVIKDEEGFQYPQINENRCIQCGKCYKLCAVKREKIELEKQPLRIIGAKVKDEQERMTSRSGGIFMALANEILKQNGVVYGCKLGENLEVHHARATNKKEVNAFKGSKYVKSNLKDVYHEVKEDLKNHRKVLFSGTGCEVAGLKVALNGMDSENLYTCDVICFGVPSPLIYQEYIKFMEEKEKNKIISIDFRDKSLGWSTHNETLVFSDRKITTNYYASLFGSCYMLRPSCYNCQFTNMSRVSDITIGDFWGIDKENKDFYDEKGVSIVLVNTARGSKLLEHILDETNWITVNNRNYLQPRLQFPSLKPNDREKFWEEYRKNGFEYIMKKYVKYEGE